MVEPMKTLAFLSNDNYNVVFKNFQHNDILFNMLASGYSYNNLKMSQNSASIFLYEMESMK